jgi:hypothetical protein
MTILPFGTLQGRNSKNIALSIGINPLLITIQVQALTMKSMIPVIRPATAPISQSHGKTVTRAACCKMFKDPASLPAIASENAPTMAGVLLRCFVGPALAAGLGVR